MSINMPSTSFLLTAMYNGAAVISLETVCRECFRHLTPEKLLRKNLAGPLELQVMRTDKSQKVVRGVHLTDFSPYIGKHRERALKVSRQLTFRGDVTSNVLVTNNRNE
jgi:hypothetical protein